VGDQYAGKQGPCPKCKTQITIPKPSEQVVIHAPDEGPKDAKGRPVLKTERTKDTKFQPMVATAVAVIVLATLLAAFLLSGKEVASTFGVLSGGAVILGPLVAWAGYTFLRDSELQPYSGIELWLRATACGLVFALAWLVYWFVARQIAPDYLTAGMLTWQMLFCGGIAMAVGGLAAFAALDLEPLNAFFLCAMYFTLTVVLRLILGLPALPGLVMS
jgi:hypothetical protein